MKYSRAMCELLPFYCSLFLAVPYSYIKKEGHKKGGRKCGIILIMGGGGGVYCAQSSYVNF